MFGMHIFVSRSQLETTILDKIVWQNLFCFLIFRHIVICLLYLILRYACPSPYMSYINNQCCYFRENPRVKTGALAQTTLILGEGE